MQEIWNLCFSFPPAPVSLTVKDGARTPVIAVCDEQQIVISLTFDFRPQPLTLSCTADVGDKLLLNCNGYRLELYRNGTLEDEEWFCGRCLTPQAFCTDTAAHLVWGSCLSHCAPRPEPISSIQGWKPRGHNVHVGDCMPYYHDGTFHLFYLYDRRGHGSKWGLGAHQWAHISTSDFLTWTPHPMAIGIDSVDEGSICTGSVAFINGAYYAFYAVRTCDGTPAKITWARSDDCIHFTKSGGIFTLSEPYDAVSARDPKAFIASDGRLHLFVTTSIHQNGVMRGCLAHLSTDMPESNHWQVHDPVRILDIEDQPECSDWFPFGRFYYLIFSNYGIARYYISDHEFGPWRAPTPDNIVVAPWLRVPKAAVTPSRLLIAGFKIDPAVNWGGTVSLQTATQSQCGTLKFETAENA